MHITWYIKQPEALPLPCLQRRHARRFCPLHHWLINTQGSLKLPCCLPLPPSNAALTFGYVHCRQDFCRSARPLPSRQYDSPQVPARGILPHHPLRWKVVLKCAACMVRIQRANIRPRRLDLPEQHPCSVAVESQH